MTIRRCFYCGPTSNALQPFGPGGSDVCLPCVRSDPGRDAAAKAVFRTLFEAAAAASGTDTVILTNGDGPQPLVLDEVRRPGQPEQ